MVAGTLVLGDTCEGVRPIFAGYDANTTAVIKREVVVSSDQRGSPAVPASLGADRRSRASSCAGLDPNENSDHAQLFDRQGQRHGGVPPSSGSESILTGQAQPAEAAGRPLGNGPGQVVIDTYTARQSALPGRRHDRRVATGRPDLPDRRVREYAGHSSAAPRSRCSTSRPPSAVPQAGGSTRSASKAKPGVSTDSSSAAQAAPAAPAPVPTAADQGKSRARTPPVPQFIRNYVLRVRRDRAVRRRVHHLQHLLDHGRPADQGARDAPRCSAPAAPGPASVLSEGRRRRSSPQLLRLALGLALARACWRCSKALGAGLPVVGWSSASDRSWSPRSSADRNAAGRPRAGDPGHPGRADRGAGRDPRRHREARQGADRRPAACCSPAPSMGSSATACSATPAAQGPAAAGGPRLAAAVRVDGDAGPADRAAAGAGARPSRCGSAASPARSPARTPAASPAARPPPPRR